MVLFISRLLCTVKCFHTCFKHIQVYLKVSFTFSILHTDTVVLKSKWMFRPWECFNPLIKKYIWNERNQLHSYSFIRLLDAFLDTLAKHCFIPCWQLTYNWRQILVKVRAVTFRKANWQFTSVFTAMDATLCGVPLFVGVLINMMWYVVIKIGSYIHGVLILWGCPLGVI